MRFSVFVLLSGSLRHTSGTIIALACAHLAIEVPITPHVPHPVNWALITGNTRRKPNNVPFRCVLHKVTMVLAEYALACELGCCKHVHPAHALREAERVWLVSHVQSRGTSWVITTHQTGCGFNSMRGWSTLAAMAYVRAQLATAISVSGRADASTASWRGAGVAGSEHAPKGTNTITIFGAGASAPSRGDRTSSIDAVALDGMTPCSMDASRRPNMLPMTNFEHTPLFHFLSHTRIHIYF
jgi:hypothetical protein